MAPGLVEIHQQYEPDVLFVGLTADSEREAQRFVRDMGITWPCGFGASRTWSAFGACGPTLFVIDTEGRIAWTDGGDRWYHQTRGLRGKLDQAIADCLKRRVGVR